MLRSVLTRRGAAATLLIAFVAMAFASWALEASGRKVEVAANRECPEHFVVLLEQAHSSEEWNDALRWSVCGSAARARVRWDGALIPCYGVFLFALLAMLAAARQRTPGDHKGWVVLGALLSASMMLSDASENAILLAILRDLPKHASWLPTLHVVSNLKWILLGVLTALASILALQKPVPAEPDPLPLTPEERRKERRRTVARWLVGFVGWIAAGGVLVFALAPGRPFLPWILWPLLAFWACNFFRAVMYAIAPSPVPTVSDSSGVATMGASSDVPDAPSPGGLAECAYPAPLRKSEWQTLCARRNETPEKDTRVGFGLSGGGIRSATVDLGLFQGLSHAHLEAKGPSVLEKIDFVSTVSGGGYFGSFLGRLWTRSFVGGPKDVAAILLGKPKEKSEGRQANEEKEKEERRARRNVLQYLRENGRYLSPNGAGDLLLGGAVVLRNWIAIQVVLMVLLVTCFLAMQIVRPGLDLVVASGALGEWVSCRFPLAGASFWWSPWFLVPPFFVLVGVVPLIWAYWLVEPLSDSLKRGGKDQGDRSSIPPLAGLLLVLTVALILAPRPSSWMLGTAVAVIAVLTLVWWYAGYRAAEKEAAAAERKAREKEAREGVAKSSEEDRGTEKTIHSHMEQRHWLSERLTAFLVVTVVLIALALVDSLGQSLYVALLGPDRWSGWIGSLGASLGVLAGFARRIAGFFSKGSKSERPSLPVSWIAGTAAFLLVTFLLVGLNAVSHAISWKLGSPPGSIAALQRQRACAEAAPGAGCTIEELSRRSCPPSNGSFPTGRDRCVTALALLFGFVLSVLVGQTLPFVNRSSHQTLYTSRLVRAYLGASNPTRWNESVTRVIRGDNCDLAQYWPPPENKAAPIHLINITVNETVSGRSQVEQRDRKGNNLALGPHGFSFGVEHHAVIPLGKADPRGRVVDVYPNEEDRFRVFDYPKRALSPSERVRVFTGESLPLGDWVGISGAAFSTGLGARTSIGLSLLAGFGNVRLGRWWDSGIRVDQRGSQVRPTFATKLDRASSRLFPVQTYLLSEFLARFHGPALRHWYLSDGGHFENLAGYELIRRRLPVIVLIDAEEDAGFRFEGLSNLVRKARIDFGAEITFLGVGEYAGAPDSLRSVVGPLEELRRGEWKYEKVPLPEGTDKDTEKEKGEWKFLRADPGGFSRAHAALATVRYADEPNRTSRLVYVKATMTGDEPADVIEYHRSHSDFPHEPTSDQFFDEAQWESYRRLGEHIAENVFRAPGEPEPEGGKKPAWWWPSDSEGRTVVPPEVRRSDPDPSPRENA
jgi:hypothetical protein